MVSKCPSFLSHVHVFTSFCDLGKCQACAALEVDVLAVDKRAERIQRLASKEVGLGSLQITLQISKRIMTHMRVNALRMA
jgi:hypothetical protein